MSFTMISKVPINFIKYLRRKGVLKELTLYVKFYRYKQYMQHYVRLQVLAQPVHLLKTLCRTSTYVNAYVRAVPLIFKAKFDVQQVLHAPSAVHRVLYTNFYLHRVLQECLVPRPTRCSDLLVLTVLAVIVLFTTNKLSVWTCPTQALVQIRDSNFNQLELGFKFCILLIHTVLLCKNIPIEFQSVIHLFTTRNVYKSTTVLKVMYKKLVKVIHSTHSHITRTRGDASTSPSTFQHRKCTNLQNSITRCPNGGFGPEFDHWFAKPRHRLHIFNFNSRFKLLNKKLELATIKDFPSWKFLKI